MSDQDLPPLPGPSGVRPWRRYLPHLGATIIARVTLGESLSEVCRDPEMPARSTVRAWTVAQPEFGRRLEAARLEGGHMVRGRKRVWCPHIARLILHRLAEGMSLRKICAEEGMPCQGTVFNWLHEREDFARDYERARLLQAQLKFEQAWEEAETVAPGTVAGARLRVETLKWQASRLAPTSYGARGNGAEARGPKAGRDAAPGPRVFLRNLNPKPGEPDEYEAPCQPVGVPPLGGGAARAGAWAW